MIKSDALKKDTQLALLDNTWLLKCKIQVNVEAELEGAAGDLGRMAVWDQIQVKVSLAERSGESLRSD